MSTTSYHYGSLTLQDVGHNSVAIINAFVTSIGKVLCSTPIIRVSSDRVIVQLFYYASSAGSVFTDAALNALGAVLSRLYPGHTVELRFVRLQRPYLNSSILAQYLAINAAKYGFNQLQNTLLNAVPFVKIDAASANTEAQPLNDNTDLTLPAHISGVKIQLAGLLTTQRAAPRKTVYSASAGTFHGVVNYAHSTSKSAVGSYTVKV